MQWTPKAALWFAHSRGVRHQMNRAKNYIAYLLLPAIPYLLMVYSPETIDSFYQYLYSGAERRYIWAALYAVLIFSLYFGIVSDAKANNVKAVLISSIKWYLLLVSLIAVSCILFFKAVLLKTLFVSVVAAIMAFYLLINSAWGKNA